MFTPPAMTMAISRLFAALLLGALTCTAAIGAAEVDYESQIKPLLKARCYACHGALKQEAGLRLDTGAAARRGSENGPVITGGSPAESTLLERVRSESEFDRMPPDGKPLDEHEVQLLQSWVAAGARSPADEQPEADPREHWAFQVPRKAALPSVSAPDWPRNPVDHFLHAQYDRHGLTPTADASPAQQLRRLYLDLIGLPPTTVQLQAFMADPSDAHYRRIVDELLDAPQYGERWGRHWMDVWRYSDWYGRRSQNDVRNSAPQIWRWRDWIVDSLNEDKSYARMIQEMLAADELAADDDSAWPATGYLVRNYYSLNPNEWMRHNVEYTGKAFLGLTFNCAHCHDHKYDPIAHDDYFRLRAFFEPIGIRQDRVAGQAEPPPFEVYVYGGSRKVIREGMVRIYDERPEAPTWFYTEGDERNRVSERGSIPPGVPSFLGVPLREIEPIELPTQGWYPGARPEVQQALVVDAGEAVAAAEQALEAIEKQPANSTEEETRVTTARQAFDDALQAAIEAGEAGALVGRQSLSFDAVEGRRIVQNTLPRLSTLPAGTTISFQLRILQDNHVNFQLARDAVKHLTALYVGFVGGKIRAYQPGGFDEATVGTYQFANGQQHFDVRLVLHPDRDQADLTVTLHGTETVLVENQPIALNGWNPTRNPNQPFTFDCRTGTRALLDAVVVEAGEQRFVWDFEAPDFRDDQDVDGIDGWLVHPLSVAPATSVVSLIAGCESARESYDAWQAARAALREVTLHATAAEQTLVAAQHRQASLLATIAADRFLAESPATLEETARFEKLAQEAYSKQLVAAIARAESDALNAEVELLQANGIPATDKDRQQKIAAAGKTLTQARQELAAARAKQSSAPVSTEYTRLSPTSSQQSTGRRSALAHWITDPLNPLTPRVAVNHIWLRHFHVPLVESVFDFGRNGKPPSHPKLLDWLAVELRDHNWSMKHIHRLIVTSRAYRMSSSAAGRESNLAKDKDNRLLWRMNQGRMEAEVVRDSVLAISGALDATLGGQVLLNSQAMTTNRRTLYYEVFPENGGSDALAEIFDAPDPTDCFRRSSTIVPQQALALSNSSIIHRCSRQAARRIAQQTGTGDGQFISGAFLAVLSRPPTDREASASQRFLDKQRAITDDEQLVREGLVRVLFNHNDFVTVR